MAIPLEDNVSDIIGKAQRGLGISDSQLAERSGLKLEEVKDLREGRHDPHAIDRAAAVLKLNAPALRKLAQGSWGSEEPLEIDGLARFNTTFHDMTVNAYLVWDPVSRDAVVFDTGADCGGILQRAKQENLNIKLILLTHAHPDHVADLRRLRQVDAPIYMSEMELEGGVQAILEGKQFRVGSLDIESRLTSGHSPGGMTYVVTGLNRPVAIVGDAIFAGSMGGGNVSYADALRNNREKILTLPDETVICPGHGPMTTVGKEKRDNAFFP